MSRRRMLIALVIALLAGLVLAPTATAGTDDYPAQWRNAAQDSTIDSWGYYNRECTSFVAWRLHARNGFEMPRAIGNAGSWGSWFSAHGYAVNGTPGVGAIAESSGHVAWVEAVNGDGTVTIEEYNYNYNGTYNERRVAASTFHYIHARDIATSTPPPGAVPYPGVGSATFKGGATLLVGQELHTNEYLMSANGQTVLVMQTDGNLVLYRATATALWNTGTGGHPGAYAVVQPDGNVVVYSAGNVPLWWTGTTGVTALIVQTDGNLVGYPSGGPAEWQAGTGGQAPLTYLNADHLAAGDQIHPDQYLRSADGRYFLAAQTDGNIVLYGPGYHVLWSTGTGGHPGGAYIAVQADGNVVVYSAAGAPLWWTGTNSTITLSLQNDGNLVGRNPVGAPTWSSGTGGQI